MLQGAINHSQKCHCVVAPNFLQGAVKSAQKCHGGNAPRERSGTTLRDVNPSPPLPPVLFGANRRLQKAISSTHQGKGQHNAAEIPTRRRPSQPVTGGHHSCAEMPYRLHPASFIWSRHDHAAMPRGKRSKGRVSQCSQKCLTKTTLPNQLQGVNTITQKCQTNVAPTEFGPSALRRNAVSRSPNNQRPSHARRNAILQTPRK